jgi:ribonuclease HI
MIETYTLHFDGSCGPINPGGTAAYGFLISSSSGHVVDKHGVIGTGPGMTNNLAEHYACAEGLNWFYEYCVSFQFQSCKSEKITVVRLSRGYFLPKLLLVRGDSMLVINQLNKKWSAHSNKPYYHEYIRAVNALKKIRKLGVTVCIDWIPREKNEECDILSKVHQSVKVI